MKKSKVITRLVLLAAIIVVLNFIVARVYMRLDFTADKMYTLSEATKNIVKDLEEPVTVTVYFSEEVDPSFNKIGYDFRDMLIEYQNLSNGNLVFEMINPESEELKQEAQQEGIFPMRIEVLKDDQYKQQIVFLGAVVHMGEEKEVLPVIQPGSSMEYSMTTAIKKLSIVEKPKIAFIQGHGEPGMFASTQVYQALSVLYNVNAYTINDSTVIPQDYKTIIIINPTDTFPAGHLEQLDRYLSKGGNIYLSLSRINGDLSSGYVDKLPKTGLEGWMASKGIMVNEDCIIDNNCGSVSVRQQLGQFAFNTQVKFPYFPLFVNFADHTITKGLETVILPFTSSLNIVSRDSAVHYAPLLRSSENSGIRSVPVSLQSEVNREWQTTDFNLPGLIAAVALEGKIVGNGLSKLVMVSNGGFAVNGEGQQAQRQIHPDNVNLAVNAIDWLSDDTGLINLRTKGVTNRPLEQLEDGTKTMLKYLNVGLPVLIILLLAFVRYRIRRRKRQMWMEDKY